MQSRFSGQMCAICGQKILAGERIGWQRNGNTANVPTPTPVIQDVSAKAYEPPTPKPTVDIPAGGLGDMLATAILPFLESKLQLFKQAQVTTEQVEGIITRLFDGMTFKTVSTVNVVTNGDLANVVDCGVQHKQFPLLLKLINTKVANGVGEYRRLNIWLTGPAGSGKTSGAKEAAKALGLNFYLMSAVDSGYQLTGYICPRLGLIRTQFREAWEHGGVCLWDEIDSWSPSACLAGNAIANGVFNFPDGLIPRHKDCVIIAAANTWGLGPTPEYVGRAKLDAAFLNRFALKMDWGYDQELELAISGNATWCARVQAVRANAKRQGIRVMITPRHTLEGAAALASGIPQDVVESLTIFNGLRENDRRLLA